MTRILLVCTFLSIGTFAVWEGVAWFSHKFIIHGLRLCWNQLHHNVHEKTSKKNNLYALVFSLPCIFILYYATQIHYNPYLISVASGFSVMVYFIFHDILVHQRIKWNPHKKNKYLKRMINAHYVHHSKHTKENCEAFGFLYASNKYSPNHFSLKKTRQETQ